MHDMRLFPRRLLTHPVDGRPKGSLALFDLTNFTDMGAVLYNGEIYAFALLGAICGLVRHRPTQFSSLCEELQQRAWPQIPPGQAPAFLSEVCYLQQRL